MVTKTHLDNRSVLSISVHTHKTSPLQPLGSAGFGSGFSSKPLSVTVFTNASSGQF